MAEMWYYTSEGVQQDPVSIRELKQLVGEGTLKPTDMVWKEGMPRWIRASSLKELFPDPGAALDKFFTGTADPSKPAAPAMNVSMPGTAGSASSSSTAVSSAGSKPMPAAADTSEKKKSTSASNDDDRRKPPRRRSEPASGGGSTVFIIIALIAGGGVLLLALVVGVVILLIAFGGGGDGKKPGADLAVVADKKDGPAPPVVDGKEILNYSVRIGPSNRNNREVPLTRGATYRILVRSEPRHPDVDCLVHSPRGMLAGADNSIGPDSKVDFVAAEDGNFRIEVVNLNGNTTVTSVVRVVETKPAPKIEQPPVTPPLPPGVREGKGVAESKKSLKGGGAGTFTLRVRPKVGYQASITGALTGIKGGAASLVSISVEKENGEKVASTPPMGPNANVTFTMQTLEVLIVRVKNESNGSANINVIFDVGQ